MKVENQVCSLEHAKKLKELGVKQESLWWWIYNKIQDKWKLSITLSECVKAHPESWDYVSAFTVAELGEMLPPEVKASFSGELVITKQFDSSWFIEYSENLPIDCCMLHETHANTEANARAKMLIWLIENKKLTKGE